MKHAVIGAAGALLFAAAAAQGQYAYDDGEQDSGLGAFGSEMLSINGFQSVAGSEWISSIEVAFGESSGTFPLVGEDITVHFWTDPNNDGNPEDAILHDSVAGSVMSSNTNTFDSFALNAPVFVGAGDWFFVGVSNYQGSQSNNFTAARDTDTLAGQSWIVQSSFGVQDIDYNDLGSAFRFDNVDTFSSGSFAGTWMIRATGGPVPAPGAFACLGLAGVGLARRRR